MAGGATQQLPVSVMTIIRAHRNYMHGGVDFALVISDVQREEY
jgi:hypothetical protein